MSELPELNTLNVTTAALGFLLHCCGIWIIYGNIVLLTVFVRVIPKKNK